MSLVHNITAVGVVIAVVEQSREVEVAGDKGRGAVELGRLSAQAERSDSF